MAIIVLKDRVKETTETTGTGSVTLLGAVDGYQAFSAIGNGNITYYAIYNPEDGSWEVGKGTYSTTGPLLSRDTVLSSSAAGAKIDFGAGTKDVFVTYPAEKAIYEELNGNTRIDGGPLTVIGSGAPQDPTTFSAALAEMYASVNSFAQVYARNFEADTEASADFIVYRDNTVDENGNFMDMGINSASFDSMTWPIFTPGSMYLYGNGGEMFIGSETSDVVFFVGGVDTTDEVGRFSATTGELTLVNDLNVTTNINAAGGTFTAPVTSTSTSITAPSSDEFVVRAYVDSATSTAFVVHPSVRLATVAALPANTYNNGTGGVGATLTGLSVGQLAIDGVNVAVGDRVLIKNEVNQAYNGAYTVTVDGSAAVYVLTRATDFDTTGSGEIANNAYFYVTAGATEIGSSWILAQTAAITVGTTALPFSLFAQPIGYTVLSPLQLSGTTLSLAGVVGATNGGTGTGTVTTGDLLYGSATNTWSKLGAGSAYGVLTMNSSGTNVQWNAVNLASSNAVTGTLGPTYGGTGQSTYALGDIIYSDASNSLAKLSGNTTTTKKFLTQTGTGSGSAAPAWGTISGSDVTSAVTTATNVAGGAANKVVYQTGPGATAFVDAPVSSGTALTWNGSSFTWASAGGATISDDTTTNTTYYPVWANATSGTMSTAYVSSTKYTFNPSTGALTAVTVTSSSDETLKTDWVDMPEDFVEQMAKVKRGTFTRIEEGTNEVGVSAQSLLGVLKQAVVEGADGKLSVAYGNAALVLAIELAERVVQLEQTVAKLTQGVSK